jgi:hypothetical protein
MYDAEVYSHVVLGGLKVPLHIHISKIQDTEKYSVPKYNNVIKFDFEKNLEDQTFDHDFFYGKFKELLQMRFILSKIYEFIDLDSINYLGYLDAFIDFTTKESFVDRIIQDENTDIYDLQKAYQELLYYITKVKEMFLNDAIEKLEALKEYPDIPTDNDPSKTNTHKKYKQHMSIGYEMISLQCLIEHSGEILFPENKDRAATEYSWREKELRRLYMKRKTEHDNFTEAVKSAIMDEMRPK